MTDRLPGGLIITVKDGLTAHQADAALPRHRVGTLVGSMPGHGMCSGSAGGEVTRNLGLGVLGITCRGCGKEKVVDEVQL